MQRPGWEMLATHAGPRSPTHRFEKLCVNFIGRCPYGYKKPSLSLMQPGSHSTSYAKNYTKGILATDCKLGVEMVLLLDLAKLLERDSSGDTRGTSAFGAVCVAPRLQHYIPLQHVKERKHREALVQAQEPMSVAS